MHQAQTRMKHFADNMRTDKEFAVGDSVYPKLHPYKQTSLTLRRNLKLNSKYYRPFTIVARIRNVAYKLGLLQGSKIHLVFYVSLLKKKVGDRVVVQSTLPNTRSDGQFLVQLVAILQRKMVKNNNVVVVRVLLQWSNLPPEDATWEDYQHIHATFPNFDPDP